MSLSGVKWDWGRAAEDAVRNLHLKAGDYVVPTHAIETGGAPKLIGLVKQHVLPDFQVFGKGAGRWVEVKYKDHADFFQKRRQWQHGIDLHHWRGYVRVEQETGIPGQLDIIQYKPGRLAEPNPVLLWQSFTELEKYVQIYAQGHSTFRHGAAYWPLNAFKCSPIDFIPPPNTPSSSKNVNPWERLAKDGSAPTWVIQYCDESPFESQRCKCGKNGIFGYRNDEGKMIWYCAEHRLAKWWADARRDNSKRHPGFDESSDGFRVDSPSSSPEAA